MPTQDETIEKVQGLRRHFAELQDEQHQGWRPHWEEIRNYEFPGAGQYLTDEGEGNTNRGEKRRTYIFNPVCELAIRNMAAGLHGGLTSPSRPWFKLGVQGPEEEGELGVWLREVRDLMLKVYARSNFYTSIHTFYEELCTFGTAVMFVEEDSRSIIRCRTLTIGEYWLATDASQRPDTVFRKISMTVRQMVERFGEDNVPSRVAESYKLGRYTQRETVVHCVYPRKTYQHDKEDGKNKPWASIYFMETSPDTEALLSESGYDTQPFVAARWEVRGGDTYGRCPGMTALPESKALQRMTKDLLKGIARAADPPLKASGDLKPTHGATEPGGVTYTDGVSGQNEGLQALYTLRPDLAGLQLTIDNTEMRIKQLFFNDLFLALLSQTKRITATEAEYQQAEKLLMIGPAVERLQQEMLDPVNDRVYGILLRKNLLPIPPAGYDEVEIDTQYISTLAQAQRLVGVTSIEQLTAYLLQLSQAAPEAMDIFDVQEAAREYAKLVGPPPSVIRSEEEARQLAEMRRQQMAAEEMRENMPAAKSAADAAKVAGEIDPQDNPVLRQLGITNA